jgi:Spy/CpxP family protein refolding chaperone
MSVSSLLEVARTGRGNPKAACAIALTLVFLCGAVVGALAMDFGVHSRQRATPFDTDQGKAAYFSRMQKDLDLTPEQSEQMEIILKDFWQFYRTVLSDSKQRIEQVLTPEQRIRFERMLQESRK